MARPPFVGCFGCTALLALTINRYFHDGFVMSPKSETPIFDNVFLNFQRIKD